jgi:signal transduction histidine kinase
MLMQAECSQQPSPAASIRSASGNAPIQEPFSAVSRMVALICHDLRLPMTAILANSEFLAQSELREREKAELHQEIRCSIDQMNALISSLVEYSRDGDTLQPAAHNIVETVESAIRMTCVKPEFRRVTIRHLHKGTAVGWYDSGRLGRVVANLVLNACEAVHPDEGRILVTTIGSRSSLELSVWDNGPGISPAIKDSIFEPFVSYGKARGSGLGLTIAKKIVTDHGGTIYLHEGNESGTLIRITIPFAIPRGTNPKLCLAP